MNTIRVINNGLEGFDYIKSKYQGMEATKENVRELKQFIYDEFINNSAIDFSTKGGESVTILDTETMDNMEIIYA